MSREVCGWVLLMACIQVGALYAGRCLALNMTDSLPRGFYWRLGVPATWARGQYLELTPPDAMLDILEAVGLPAGVHVLKQLAGLPGDTVCWDVASMTVNATSRAARLPERPLPVALAGCRTLGSTEVVLLGTHPRSLDSRDVGPIDRRRVLYALAPLWTWKGQ